MNNFKIYLDNINRINRLANNYLAREGWFNGAPCDADGPTPWYTYPAIDFFKNLVNKNNKIFEYGSGYSTKFYNRIGGEVVSVEHDSKWAQQLQLENPQYKILLCEMNSSLDVDDSLQFEEFLGQQLFAPVSNNTEHNVAHGLLSTEFRNYAAQIFKWPKGYFDIIVIDGMARILTGFYAADQISENGYIVLDNSDRWQYNSLQQYLVAQGFQRIDFWGVGPVNDYKWCTSVFSKNFKIIINNVSRTKGSGDLGW